MKDGTFSIPKGNNKVCIVNGLNPPTQESSCVEIRKAMLIVFFNMKCIVDFEFILQGQRVDQTYYVEILKWLYEVHSKRPEFWPRVWILHHDTMTSLQPTGLLCQTVSGSEINY